MLSTANLFVNLAKRARPILFDGTLSMSDFPIFSGQPAISAQRHLHSNKLNAIDMAFL